MNPQIKVAKPAIVAEEPLQAELRSFLEAVRTRSKPLVSFEDGRRALALALDIVAAIREHSKKVQTRAVALNPPLSALVSACCETIPA